MIRGNPIRYRDIRVETKLQVIDNIKTTSIKGMFCCYVDEQLCHPGSSNAGIDVPLHVYVRSNMDLLASNGHGNITSLCKCPTWHAH